jgi:Cu2+-exporting ATPase
VAKTLTAISSENISEGDYASCYHCGLPVVDPVQFTFFIQDKSHSFCCAGCQAVASLIHESGLDQFYQYRSRLNQKVSERAVDYRYYDRGDIQQPFVVDNGDQQKTAYLLLDGITCAACVWLIEHSLGSISGVSNVTVNAATHQCIIRWHNEQQMLSVLMQRLAALGYRPQPFTRQQQQQQQQQQQRSMLLRMGFAGFAMMQVGMVAVALYAGALQGIDAQWVQLLRWVSLLVASPVVLFSAQPFWMAAWRCLKPLFAGNKTHLTMDVPVSLAIILAYLASAWATITQSGEVYFDSIAMFTFFLLLGRYLEMRLRYRNQQQLGVLTELLPMTVNRVISNPASNDVLTEVVALTAVKQGDRLRVITGDTIPCDGLVVDGVSAVVEALLTGESEALNKTVGDKVIAGTVNTEGTLVIEVTATGDSTRLSTINRLVKDAEQEKPLAQQIADRVASYFVLAVLLVSVLVFWLWYNIDPSAALWVTLSVLVVTCPCALSLATPTALTAAVAVMQRKGLLILKSHVIEALTTIDTIVFDKTGTLTIGQPKVTKVVVVDEQVDAAEALIIAASLEQGSSHPIATAFSDVRQRRVVDHLTVVTASGVSGMIAGSSYRLGKPAFALEMSTKKTVHKKDELAPPASTGQWLLLSKNRQALAWIALNDPLRSSAVEAIATLRSQGLRLEILSGDSDSAVSAVATELGVAYLAEQTPEQKFSYVCAQQKQQHRLLMVGDGINDVPVLTRADVSIAMDSATDFARTRADSILLANKLMVLPQVIAFAHKAKAIIRQNIIWAIAYNALALPLAAFGYIPPYLAAIGMSLSSLVVLVNAMRLYRF